MKYSTTQPSTDPSAAMNAYSGIRAGCSIDSSISNRSLMTGKVSTEESRKEMRKSPGAPSPLANATTFCFHPLKFICKSGSSDSTLATCVGTALDLNEDEGRDAQLLRKGRAVEMIHEYLHQRGTVQVRQL